MDVGFRYGGATIPAVPITTGPAPTPRSVAPGAHPAQPPQGFPALNPSASTRGLQLYQHPLELNVGSAAGSATETLHTATITLRSDVLFAFAKSKLTAKARHTLAALVPQIRSRATGPTRVTGYTDSIGTDAVNIPLSKARAGAVVADLKPLTPGVTYLSDGRGSSDPIAPNTTTSGADNPAGRALNRRVTIVIPVKAPAPPTPPPAADQTGPAPSSGSSVTFHPPGNDPTDTFLVSPISLSRDGSLALLRFNITCHAHQAGPTGCFTETDFTGTHNVPPLPGWSPFGGGNPNKVAGLYLTDPSSGLIYSPVYDATGYDVMSDITSGIPDGATLPAWVYFAVPPASQSTMVLHMPGGTPSLKVSFSAGP
jgi:outer membrane protein OmpA-like peptidoglycan-associated protein